MKHHYKQLQKYYAFGVTSREGGTVAQHNYNTYT